LSAIWIISPQPSSTLIGPDIDIETEVTPEATPLQPTPKEASEYCDECIQTDRAFEGISESLARITPPQDCEEKLLVPLKADFTTASNTCPSCRDILEASEKLGLEYSILQVRLHASALGFERLGPTEKPTGWASCLDKDGHNQLHKVYLLKRTRYPSGLREPTRGSVKSLNIDIGSIQEQLQTCDSHHDSCRNSSTETSGTALYLVDIIHECITSTPISGVCYVALSYVWGNSQVIKLTSKNIATLTKYRSLSLDSQNHIVPRAIRDAMRLTAELGIRYLWADCLCIVQDDPNIGYYLNRMDSI
jgi:hypothetical protein